MAGPNTSVYKMGQGDHLLVSSLAPRNYQDSSGRWRRIETSLHHRQGSPGRSPRGSSDQGDEGGFENGEGPVDVFFPDSLGPSTPITFSIPDGVLAVVPEWATEGTVGVQSGDVVAYADAAPGIDVTYTPTALGYEEHVVLKERPTDDRLTWSIQSSDLTLRQEQDGGISALAGGDVVATFPVTLVVDSSEDPEGEAAFTNFDYEITVLGGGVYEVSVLLDQAWLSDPARVYPITIDPSPWAHTFSPNTGDTFATSCDPGTDESGWYAVDAGGSCGALTFLKFDLSGYRFDYRLVYAADLAGVAITGGGLTTNGTVNVKRPTQNWQGSTLTWNNLPTVSSTVWESASAEAGDVVGGVEYWHPGDLYQHIVDLDYNNYGVELQSANSNWHRWCSANPDNINCTSGAVPQLYLVYNDLPYAATLSSPVDLATVSVASPELSVSAMPGDHNGDSTRVDFQVSKDGTHWSGTNLVADSGWLNSTNWVVDAGALQDGHTYYWRTQSADWCTYDGGVQDICSNVDASGVTHPWAVSATVRSFTVNLPHYGADSNWAMWTHGLGNSMSVSVEQATGNLFLSYPLDVLKTPIDSLDVSLSYNSQLANDTHTVTDIGLGAGWNVAAGPLSDALKLPTLLEKLSSDEGGGVLITFGDGGQKHYPRLAPGINTFKGEGADAGTVYKSPKANPSSTDVIWTYTTDTGGQFTFNNEGNLLSAAPASDQPGRPGFGYTFAQDPYSLVWHIATVKDPLNRQVTFTWTGSSPSQHLTSISTWVPAAGGGVQTWTLAYDAGKLSTVTNPANETVKFTYDTSTPPLLTGIQDGELVKQASPSKTEITYQYGSPNRAKTVKLPPPTVGASVNPTTFQYGPQLNGSIVQWTAAIDPRSAQPPPDASSRTSSVPYTAWTDFNTAGNPIRVFGPYDNNGYAQITRTVWDGNGNVVCVRSSYANAAGGEKCVNPTDGVYTNLGDALNTDYVYQTTAPYGLTQVTEPAPNADGTGTRASTTYLYDEGFKGLLQQGYLSTDLSGVASFVNIPGAVNWNWGGGAPVEFPAGTGEFSLRLTGTITATTTRTYSFKLKSGDGARLVIGNTLLVDCWQDGPFPNCGDTAVTKKLTADKPTAISIEYYNKAATARLELWWDQGNGSWVTVPNTQLASHLNRVTTMTDPLGTSTWSYADDSAKIDDHPSSMTRGNRTATYAYTDTYGRPTSRSVTVGTTTLTSSSVYAGACLTQTTDPAGAVTDFTCNGAGDVTQMVQHVPAVPNTNQSTSQDRVTDTTYDEAGRINTVSVPHLSGATGVPLTDYDYDSAGRLAQSKDPMGFITTYQYFADGNLSKKTLPSPDGVAAGPVWQYAYDGAGDVVTVTDPRNHQWTSAYDALGRIVQATTPAGTQSNPGVTYTTTTIYSFTTRTTTVNAPGGLDITQPGVGITISTVATYDVLGRKLSEQLGGKTPISLSYDAAGDITSQTVAGVRTDYLYDSFGRKTRETCLACKADATDAVTYLHYDEASDATGALTSVTDARATQDGQATYTSSYAYDNAGRMKSSSLPNSLGTTTVLYDAAGERVQVTDGAGKVRNWTYDERGRLATAANARGTATYSYDDDNRVTQVALPAGLPATQATVLHYTYDNLGRRTHRWGTLANQQTSSAESFGYDPNGNLTSASTDSGSAPAITVAYDDANRPWTVAQSTATTTYGYVGTEISTLTDPAGTDSYRYQASDGLMARMTSAFGGNLDYSYDGYGRVSTRTDPSGLTSTVAYDGAGRPRSKQVDVTGGGPLVCFERVYDAVGDVINEAQRATTACGTQGTWPNTYAYDGARRLQASTEGGTTTTYGYDGAGNRTTVQVGTGSVVTTSYDGAGYPTSATDGTTYTVDPLGELTASAKGGQTTSFSYDAWGRAVGATVPSVGSLTYAYDALDRTRTRVGASTTTYQYVGATEKPASMATGGSTQYLDHTRAGPFAQKSGSTVRYHVTDLHSDVVGLVASGGTYAGQTQFDPWGTRVASGTTGTQPAVGFQGDVTDADTGLVDMGTRLYLPSIGRFTTQDSVFGDLANPMSMNQFTYGQDNPATFIDPTGMCVGGYMFADCYNPDVQATWSEMISNTSRAETAEEAKTIVTWQSGINKMIAINTSPVFRPLPKPPAPKGSCHGLLGCIGNFVSNHGLQIVVGVAIAVTTAALVVSLAPVAIAVGGALLEGSLTGAALAIADATLVAEAGAVALENEAATDVEAVTVGGEAVAAETESGGLAEAFHYTGSQNVASIEANGLRAGSYPTPNGGLSPLQAQIDLALPPNRGLPGAALRIDVAGLRDAGYDIPEVTQVGRSYNMPGGGYEMQFPYPIPPEFIKAVP